MPQRCACDSVPLRTAKCQTVARSEGWSGRVTRLHQPAVPCGMAESSGSHLLLCLQPVPCRNSSCSWTEASSYRAGWAFWIRLSNHAVHLLGLWASSQNWILREVLPFCFHVQCFTANSALATSRPLKKSLESNNGPGRNLSQSTSSLLVWALWGWPITPHL